MTPTFNVKPKTRDRRAGSGGELNAKQEKLGLKVILLHGVIVSNRRTSVRELNQVSFEAM
jgi:hypothetical protein